MEKSNLKIKSIFKGVIISFISTLILLLVFATILTYTNVSENTTNPVILTVSAISILIGSSIGNIKIKKNGIINGGTIGCLYMLIIYIISSLINNDFGLNFSSFVFIISGVIFGIIGGIIGVNKK